ncbi:MAG: hypothetical protein ACLQU3_11865 [Limisphaerales bacterium]
MRAIIEPIDGNLRDEPQYALCRGRGFWEVTFEGREATFRDEVGAPYIACLLLHPPRKPIHALALALEARTFSGQTPGAADAVQQRYLGLDEAEAVRNMRRRERELEAVLDDEEEIEPVKAEALRELEAIADFMRQHPWRSRDCVQKCARAASLAIRCLHARLAGAVDAEGKPDPVLQAFARHLDEHLLIPSDGGGIPGRFRLGAALPGWFTYKPPRGTVWKCGVRNAECGVQSPTVWKCGVRNVECGVQGPTVWKCGVRNAECGVQSSTCGVQSRAVRRPAAVGYLDSLLCAGLALGLLATGCAGPRPLKGGRAVITHKPTGGVEQTLVQSENPAQATKQDQESVKVRSYTVPAGSRMEQSQMWEGERPREPKLPKSAAEIRARGDARPPDRQQPSTLNPQPSSPAFILSAPMPVVEREETHVRTELGAAQKDTARELGARLSSLKGIVWVGVGLFVFGLASLVWPPLNVVIGSVTTSAALMLGGVALMVLPSLIAGNELLILGVVGLVVGGWFLAHRHGQLRGLAAAGSANGEGGGVKRET